MAVELSFEFYGQWFRNLSTEHQELLIDHDMSPEVVRAAYQARVQSNAPKAALREFRSTIEYRAHYLVSPPHVQRELSRMGINEHVRVRDNTKVESNRWDSDPAESRASAHSATADLETSKNEDERYDLCDRFGIDIDLAEQIIRWRDQVVADRVAAGLMDGLRTIVAWLIQETNLKLLSGALAFAAGLDALNGIGSMTEFALRIGVTKSAVSKKVKKIACALNLPTNPNMKSKSACDQYKKNGLENHWRKQTYGASS